MDPETPKSAPINVAVYSPTIEFDESEMERLEIPPAYVTAFRTMMDAEQKIHRTFLPELFSAINVPVDMGDLDIIITAVVGSSSNLSMRQVIGIYREWMQNSQSAMTIPGQMAPTRLVPVKVQSYDRWQKVLNCFTLSEQSVVSGRKLLGFSVVIIVMVAITIIMTTIGVEIRDGLTEGQFDLDTNHDILATITKYVSVSQKDSDIRNLHDTLGLTSSFLDDAFRRAQTNHNRMVDILGFTVSTVVNKAFESRLDTYNQLLSFVKYLVSQDIKSGTLVDEVTITSQYDQFFKTYAPYLGMFYHCGDKSSTQNIPSSVLDMSLKNQSAKLTSIQYTNNGSIYDGMIGGCANCRLVQFTPLVPTRNCTIGIVLSIPALSTEVASDWKSTIANLTNGTTDLMQMQTTIQVNTSNVPESQKWNATDNDISLIHFTGLFAVEIKSTHSDNYRNELVDSLSAIGQEQSEIRVDLFTGDSSSMVPLSGSSIPSDAVIKSLVLNVNQSHQWGIPGNEQQTVAKRLTGNSKRALVVTRSKKDSDLSFVNLLSHLFQGFADVDGDNEIIAYIVEKDGNVTWLSSPICKTCNFLNSKEAQQALTSEALRFDGVNYRGIKVRGVVGTSANVSIVLLKGYTSIMEKINRGLEPLIISSVIITVVGSLFMFIMVYSMNRQVKRLILKRTQMQARLSKLDGLLENMFPTSIKERILTEGHIIEVIGGMSVSFLDIHSFTPITNTLSSQQLQKLLSYVFNALDTLGGYYGPNKVKTIGDCYFAVCGLPGEKMYNDDPIEAMFLFVLNALLIFSPDFTHNSEMEEILGIVSKVLIDTKAKTTTFALRAGMASGNVLCGVLPGKVPSFDVWGPVINLAARLEANGVPGSVTVSEHVYHKLEGCPFFSNVRMYGPQKLFCKGFGSMQAYILSSTDLEVPKELRSALQIDYKVGKHTFTPVPEVYQTHSDTDSVNTVGHTYLEPVKTLKSERSSQGSFA